MLFFGFVDFANEYVSSTRMNVAGVSANRQQIQFEVFRNTDEAGGKMWINDDCSGDDRTVKINDVSKRLLILLGIERGNY